MGGRLKRSRIRRVGKRATLNKELDALWSKLVRARAGWKCQGCGSESRLQGAHVYPKGAFPHLRHDPDNGLCLCWACHLGPHGWHKHPALWGEKWKQIKGEGMAEHLRFKAYTATGKRDRAATKLYLERELGRIGA